MSKPGKVPVGIILLMAIAALIVIGVPVFYFVLFARMF